jgi:hypothetical protein
LPLATACRYCFLQPLAAASNCLLSAYNCQLCQPFANAKAAARSASQYPRFHYLLPIKDEFMTKLLKQLAFRCDRFKEKKCLFDV